MHKNWLFIAQGVGGYNKSHTWPIKVTKWGGLMGGVLSRYAWSLQVMKWDEILSVANLNSTWRTIFEDKKVIQM